MSSVVVYTTVLGDYDEVAPAPRRWAGDARFVLFADSTVEAPGWEIRSPVYHHPDPCRAARAHKILAAELFPTATHTLWLDGSVAVSSSDDVASVLGSSLDAADICVHAHRCRNCLYDEALACIRSGKDAPEIIEAQTRRYAENGYPRRNGLAETMVLARRHSPACAAFCAEWMREVNRGSRRDQLSFNYVAWKLRFHYQSWPWPITLNPHFDWGRHKGPAYGVGEVVDAKRLSTLRASRPQREATRIEAHPS